MTGPIVHHLDEVMNHCIHCGLCLPVCPTYALTQQEQSSPRGRIRLIRSVHDGSLPMSDGFVDEMSFCLDCQACETACPAGVRYGMLLEDARGMISERGREPFFARLLKKAFFAGVLSSPSRTRSFGRLLRTYERTGLRKAVSGLLTGRLREKHELLPFASGMFFDEEAIPRPAPPVRGRVAFLTGCIMNVAFAEVHRDAVRVLAANGYEVVIPDSQVCCGSLQGHNGAMEAARSLARQNVDAFERVECDSVVVDSAGCGAFMKEYGHLLAGDPEYAARAERLAAKTLDISEFLVRSGFRRPEPRAGHTSLPVVVTYHEACHLVHTQRISGEPREIIRSIPGVTLTELPEATWCCGSAGIYNVLRFGDSMKLLDRKMENIRRTGAEILATANPGCHQQLRHGIRKCGLTMDVVHPVSLLARAYEGKL